MKKIVLFVALWGLGLGTIPQVQAGVVPPTPGGGGGGNEVPSIYMSSGINNHLGVDSFWDASAWGNVGGPIATRSINSSFSFTPNADPKPGNAGQFNINISADGVFFPADGSVTPEMQDLITNPISSGGNFNVSKITVKQQDQWIIYNFNPALLISWNGNGSVYPGYEGGPANGSLYGNVSILGGRFTSSSPFFQINHWDGKGPRPDWIPDWNAGFNFSGIATPSSVTILPEPVTMALLAIGGIATYFRRRRIA